MTNLIRSLLLPDFDPSFLPILALVLLILAVEAALLGVGVAGAWWLMTTLAALDPLRNPGELALSLLGIAAVAIGAGYLWRLATNSDMKGR